MHRNWKRGYRTHSRNGQRVFVFKGYEFDSRSQHRLVKSEKYNNLSFEFCEIFDWDVEKVDITNIHISSAIISDSMFDNCLFKTEIDYQASMFMNVYDVISFYDCTFENISFGNSTFDGCKFHRCKFIGCDFQTNDIKNTWFHENTFQSCTLNNNRIEWSIMKGNLFLECVGDFNEIKECSMSINAFDNSNEEDYFDIRHSQNHDSRGV